MDPNVFGRNSASPIIARVQRHLGEYEYCVCGDTMFVLRFAPL